MILEAGRAHFLFKTFENGPVFQEFWGMESTFFFLKKKNQTTQKNIEIISNTIVVSKVL